MMFTTSGKCPNKTVPRSALFVRSVGISQGVGFGHEVPVVLHHHINNAVEHGMGEIQGIAVVFLKIEALRTCSHQLGHSALFNFPFLLLGRLSCRRLDLEDHVHVARSGSEKWDNILCPARVHVDGRLPAVRGVF